MKAAFVYANPRTELAAQVAAGTAPDTGLLGENHIAPLGIATAIHEPAVRRRQRAHGLRHRLTWNLRELTLPWELGDADVAVTPLCNVFPLSARLRRRPRVVVLDYGIGTVWRRSGRVRRTLLGTAVRSAAGVGCLSASQRDTLVATLGADPARVRILPLGVDERFFQPVRQDREGYVLAVGKDPARDYETLARASAGIARRVLLVAHPRNVEGLRLPPNVEVVHDISWPALRAAYAGAACVVLPVRRLDHPFGTDGSGLTALVEAMAMGKPIVVSDRPVFRDYVEDGESCLQVPPEDEEALRGAIEQLLADEDLAARLGSRCRRLVEEGLTTRHFAARLADFLRAVA